MTERIVELARAMGAPQGQDEALTLLCQAAADTLTRMLRPGLTPQDCESAFLPAAAWMALAGMQAPQGGVTSFTAGEVAIRREGDGRDLWDQALRLMAPYLSQTGFLFQGVRG